MKHWRSLLELAGGACLVAGAAMYDPILGLVVAGVTLVFAANFSGGDHRADT